MGQNQIVPAQKVFDDAIHHGKWIIFENCHIATDWMNKLECLYINLIESADGVINDDFRWWFILNRTTSFPLIILRDAIKIAVERPSDWRSNMIHQYASEPMCTEKFFSQAFAQQPSVANIWYRFVFAINAVHAVLLERLAYGSIGWSQPYEFNDNIRKITLFQLRSFLKQSASIPYESFFYLANDCNYGNEIIDQCDRRLLENLLERFCSEDAVTNTDYKFFDCDILRIPLEPNRENCTEYFNKLPPNIGPHAFGLPNNVEYLRNVNDGNTVSSISRLICNFEPKFRKPDLFSYNDFRFSSCKSFTKHKSNIFRVIRVEGRLMAALPTMKSNLFAMTF